MAAAAETVSPKFDPIAFEDEEYAHSLSTWRYLGELVMRNAEAEELQGAEQLAYRDFSSGVAEHIKTDPELRTLLDVESRYEYPINDGKACNANGVPVVAIIDNAVESARLAAEQDGRMTVQYWRDMLDKRNAEQTDEMPTGTSRFALSMEPKFELKADPKFWQKWYRKGIAYFQWYSKVSDEKLIAGAVSIDLSDEATWRFVFEELGEAVPENVSPNEWVSLAFERVMDSEQAQAFVLAIRERYYQLVNASGKRHSLNQLLEKHEQILKTNFEVYGRALSRALATKHNNEILQGFAQTLLQQPLDKLRPEVRRQLVRMANSPSFDAESGRLMDDLLQYAVVEQLRKNLKVFLSGQAPHEVTHQQAGSIYNSSHDMPPEFLALQLNRQLASNIAIGVHAGREYGGCSGLSLTRDLSANFKFDELISPQDIFGGKVEQSEQGYQEAGVMKCVHCPKCRTFHEEVRPKHGRYTCKNRECGYQVRA